MNVSVHACAVSAILCCVSLHSYAQNVVMVVPLLSACSILHYSEDTPSKALSAGWCMSPYWPNRFHLSLYTPALIWLGKGGCIQMLTVILMYSQPKLASVIALALALDWASVTDSYSSPSLNPPLSLLRVYRPVYCFFILSCMKQIMPDISVPTFLLNITMFNLY